MPRSSFRTQVTDAALRRAPAYWSVPGIPTTFPGRLKALFDRLTSASYVRSRTRAQRSRRDRVEIRIVYSGDAAIAKEAVYVYVQTKGASVSGKLVDGRLTLQPTSYNEARVVGDLVRGGQLVVLFTDLLHDDDRRRMTDFVEGLLYGLGGEFVRLGETELLLSPRTKIKVDNLSARPPANGDY